MDANILIADIASPRRKWVWLSRAIWCGLGMATMWAVAALYFDVRVPWLRVPLAAIYGFGLLAVWVRVRRPWKLTVTATAFALVLGWWLSLQPSNERDWLPDLAVLPWAEISGNRATIHHIRNCEYRTETDFDVRHYDRTFDLDTLQTVDLFVVYWGSPLIAHTMVSFGFEGGDPVCFSIEVRKERGEGYSAVKGFFRQFEITYVIADERDLVRLRTNYRQGEDVYLYRVRMTPERARAFFLEYLRRANELKARAEWYNVLTSNCTTGIRFNVEHARGFKSRWDWRILANGRSDEMLYEAGAFASPLPFAELKKSCYINPRGQAAKAAADYPTQIRAGVPGMNAVMDGVKKPE